MNTQPQETQFCTVETLLSLERNGILYHTKKHPNVSDRKKTILFEWLLDVCAKFKLRRDVWFYAVSLFNSSLYRLDNDLEVPTIKQEDIQLLGMACAIIAAKKLEVYAPEISDFVYICDGAYDREQILAMEKRVAIALECNFELPNIMEYNRHFSTINQATMETHASVFSLCRYFYDRNWGVLPSLVLSSAHYLTSKIFDTSFVNVFCIPMTNIEVVASTMLQYRLKGQSSKPLEEAFQRDIKAYSLNFETYIQKLKDLQDSFKNNGIITDEYLVKSYSKSTLPSVKMVNADYFKKVCKLGEGTYGEVYKVEVPEIGFFAFKKIKREHMEEGLPSSFIREVSILRNISHPNVISLSFIEMKKFGIGMPLMDSDLKSFMANNADCVKCIPFQDECAKQLLSGLEYIHSQGIVIRDIKPQNILVKGKWGTPEGVTFKYCDFGLARGNGLVLKEYNNMTNEICTLWYRPPELLLGAREYGPSVDIWSLVCTLNEMCTGKALFAGDSTIDQARIIFNLLGSPANSDWPEALNLINYRETTYGCYKSTFYEDPEGKWSCSVKLERVIRKGLIQNPFKRGTIKELVEIFNKVDIPMSPHQKLWKEKYENSPPPADKSKCIYKMKEFMDKCTSEKKSSVKVQIAAELYDYISKECVGMLVSDEKLRNMVCQKIKEFQKENFLDYVKPETKEFVFALSGIECM